MWGDKPGLETRSAPGDVFVLTLTGDHDLSTKPQLTSELAGLKRATAVIIDLTRCTFIDSSIIGTLLGARRGRPRAVSLVLPPDSSYVLRALSIAGLQDALPTHASVEAALAAIARDGPT